MQLQQANPTNQEEFTYHPESSVEAKSVIRQNQLDNRTIRRVVANPKGASHETILAMHQQYGNRAVQRMLRNNGAGATIQRGLFDRFKKEAKPKTRQRARVTTTAPNLPTPKRERSHA